MAGHLLAVERKKCHHQVVVAVHDGGGLVVQLLGRLSASNGGQLFIATF